MSAVTQEFGGIDVSATRPLAEVQKGYTSFLANDVLFAKITPCMENGKLAVVPPLPYHIAFGSTEFHVLRATPAAHPAWLAYFLSQTNFRKLARQNMTGSAGQMRVATTWLSSAAIPVPPVAEQARILEKLEELLPDLDAGIAELNVAQKKLSLYRQSLLKAAVGGTLTAPWREVQSQQPDEPKETGAQLLERVLTERRARWEIKQLAKFKDQRKAPPNDWRLKYSQPVQPRIASLPDLPAQWAWASVEQVASDESYALAIGPFGSNLKVSDYRDAGVPLVFVRNIRSRKYGGATTRYVTAEKAEELKAHGIEGGDVLVTKMGEPPGDSDVYPIGQSPAIITADCIKVRCWPGLMEPAFLSAIINSYIGRQQIGPITQGVAQKKVSLGRFSFIALPLPPVDEQRKILEWLAAAEGEIGAQEVAVLLALKKSAAQRQNILKAAFSGQLVPQDPNDEPAAVLLERIRAERAAAGTGSGKRGRKTRALS
ncbi:hypothetical protein THSYN_07865 [Candidatus Thiodictyon syntrophicum]|uniref:Type I restriction modification DNA specificity domain-containing protein n=2 Tax=Candidatus Thiodictyon syntrophicum TaxID=1166950 RepID=A0A2K8UGT7_9GAMM|nr:hypothetical protein THSYN_07865 [Candidatus Thiodictyon syntrophicum]